MAEYRQLHSILDLNGKNHAVDLQSWANLTLTGSDLTEFQADMATLNTDFLPYFTAGNIVFRPIEETMLTSESTNLTIIVGRNVTRSEDLPLDPRMVKWVNRMQEDPQVIKYNLEIRIS
jgi:hypothetical protein